jgi:hypothetical protein
MLAGVQPDDGGKNECPSHPKKLKSYGQAIEALKHRPYCEALSDGNPSFPTRSVAAAGKELRRRNRHFLTETDEDSMQLLQSIRKDTESLYAEGATLARL